MLGNSRQCISSEKYMSLVDSNANFVGDAFSKLQFFVVQDIFFSNTLPLRRRCAAGSAQLGKREGTFTSTERRIQRLYQVLEPLEDWPTGLERSSRISLIRWGLTGSINILLK